MALIDDAFRGVSLGNGVSLHETIEIDDYRTVLKSSTARQNDETHDWKKLVTMPEFQKVKGIGGISFFDAEGLRFHLPAYLTLAVRNRLDGDIFESLIFSLTLSDYSKERFKILNNKQRGCARDALKYLHECDIYPLSEEEFNLSINGYWANLQ